MSKVRSCETCKFSEVVDDYPLRRRRCRRFPSVFWPGRSILTQSVMVSDFDWCWEYKEFTHEATEKGMNDVHRSL